MYFTRSISIVGLSSILFFVLNCSEEPIQTDLSNNKYNFLNSFNKRKKINDTKLSKIFKDFKLEIKKQKGLKIVLFKNIYKVWSAMHFLWSKVGSP